MSVILSGESLPAGAITSRCWECDTYAQAGEPLVIRVTSPGVIVLHADCARRLGTHLIADSREAELASGESPWRQRATRAACASLAKMGRRA